MLRSKSVVGRRAWNILRLALLWARKGGVFVDLKKRLDHLSHFHFLNHSNSTTHTGNNGNGKGALQYGDRQLSFDATPMIHIRMHRPNSMRFRLPHIPCINPTHSNHGHMFDFDDDDDQIDYQPRNTSFLIIGNGGGQQEEEEEEEEEYIYDTNEEEEDQIENGIDLKAEEFIANFYEQLKLQRQFNPSRRRSNDLLAAP
ncbi:hypothetical protein L6452_43383 [Arctium lappa]|uniref:Uncharacterized protein n=1 Tax=Arctium lappa TaxID=4217 RepID=A0ACB8XKU0_ARCLA|nr:hypothetical protein L6452_43383 [Arctium lappa]